MAHASHAGFHDRPPQETNSTNFRDFLSHLKIHIQIVKKEEVIAHRPGGVKWDAASRNATHNDIELIRCTASQYTARYETGGTKVQWRNEVGRRWQSPDGGSPQTTSATTVARASKYRIRFAEAAGAGQHLLPPSCFRAGNSMVASKVSSKH